jgi:hypothetical protein
MASSAPPSIYFPGINFNLSFYTEGDSSVTLNYVNANFLRSTGYAFSRAITTTFNGILYALNGIDTTNINATGTITANLFNGSGAGLTNLNASNVTGGTFSVSVGGTGLSTLPAGRLLVGNNTNPVTQSGNLTWDNSNNIFTASNISGNGSRLTNLNATNISDGTLTVTRGGTGASSFTANRILIGNGTSAITEDADLTWNGTSNTLISTNLSIPGTSILTGNVGIGTTTVVTNVLQVGAGGRLRIANNNTDFTIIGSNDADGSSNTAIVISGSSRATNAGNIQYIATAANGSHQFFTTVPTTLRMTISSSGVNVNNNFGVSGNSGFGTAPHSTHRLDVNGTLNATNLLVGGNVGIGNTVPLGTLHLGDASKANNDGHIIFARCTTVGSTRICRAGYNNNFDFCIGDIGGNNTLGTWLQQFRINFQAPADSLVVSGSGYVGIGTVPSYRAHIRCNYNNAATGLHLDANDNGNPNQYSLTIWPYVIGGGEVGWRFRVQTQVGGDNTPLTLNSNGNVVIQSNLNVGSLTVNSDTFISSSRLVLRGNNPTLYLRDTDHRSGMIHMNGNIMYFLNASGNDSETWAFQNGQNWALQIDMNNNLATFGGQITAFFVAVNLTNTDYLCVQTNYSFAGQGASQRICVGFGSFTAFHRCYTDEELYNNETDESIDLFKNNYMGRVVIATGKIKSDFTRTIEANTETEIDGLSGLPKEKEKINEWYSVIDKDGISVEDAVPVVQLSRQRKDKRVFGVLGAPKRSTNNKDRLIVNSIGEGAICVSNTNGNIENGDYIQSSNLLGYGEKQDDDLLHNYTIAKSTIDCNFELDSPYYQCHEIENGVRVAFIACSYHCG